MNTYIYTNHKDETVIVIHADSISAADAEYEKQTGQHPVKLSHVGCEIKFGKA
jgi:hypothetical protein